MQHDGFADIDTKTPSAARIYDYMLGGTDNYAVDRMAADMGEEMLPGTKAMARNNRRFLERAVRYLAVDCGIRQFIDNGSGLPTQSNVHQIAQGIDPRSRVVYVDNDPVVLRHQNFGEPAAALYLSFLHFIPDADDPWGMVRQMMSRLAPGSYLAISHVVSDDAGLRQHVTGMAAEISK